TVEPTAGSRHGAHPEGIAVHAGDHQETHDLLAANAPSDIRCEPERNRVQHPLFYGCALLQRKHPDYQEIGSRSAGDQRRRRPDQPGSCEPPDQRDSRNARWWRCSHINGLPEWLCDAYGERQRRGDAAGGKGKDFRTLRYDKACGTRYGTWLVGSRRHRLCPWRADQRYQCARQGFAFCSINTAADGGKELEDTMSRKQEEHSVLVVDDSEETVELIKRNLEGAGYQVYAAHNVQDGLTMLESVELDLLITDLNIPGQSGIHLIRHVSDNYHGVGVLVITGFPSIQGAVESIKIGAEEYLVKPFTDEELFKAVDRVVSKSRVHKRKEGGRLRPQNFGIIGESEGMLKVFRTIEKIRSTNATVLISGESGTGKELVARAVHYGGKGSKA